MLAVKIVALTTVFLLALAVSLTGQQNSVSRPNKYVSFWDEMNAQLRELAGGQAADCGRVESNTDPTRASDCAVDAFQRHTAFYVIYQMQGFDSHVGRALAGNAFGQVYALAFDSNGAGWDAKGDEVVTENHHILYKPCVTPVKLLRSRTGRLNCPNLSNDFNRDPGLCRAEPVNITLPGTWVHGGSLDAKLIVGATGTVSNVEVTKADTRIEDDQLVSRMRSWTFNPALKDGHSVAVRLTAHISLEQGVPQVSFP